jgi:4-amino-4-deoxy-L-arabinose transferase-like glycosyltransferase
LNAIFARKDLYLFLLPLLLLIPALLVELGTMPLLADEPTRALVSLEMNLSNDYLVPTINGKYYYNKPPLYNWILASLFQLTGSESEWVVRTPVIVSLLLFSGLIFWVFYREFSFRVAYFTSFAMLTCGRILFYDSFLGLMDVLFSSLIFLNGYLIFFWGERKKYLLLFVFSYLLISICYMLKGLPGLVFQAITLLVYFTCCTKKIKSLLSWQHLLGIGTFLIFPMVYYSLYLQENSLDTLFSTVLNESTKRTALNKSLLSSVTHFFTFPFQFILDFLPWSLLVLVLIKKTHFQSIFSAPFSKFIFWNFVGNILIYWLSPETVPRYLFMFLPLCFGLCFQILETQHIKIEGKIPQLLVRVLAVLLFVATLFSPLGFPSFSFMRSGIPYFISLLVVLPIVFISFRSKGEFVLLLFSLLLTVRIIFNLIVLPYRTETEKTSLYKEYGIQVGKLTKGSPLYLYKCAPVNHDISFYISRERRDILRISFDAIQPGTYYISDIYDPELTPNNSIKVYEFYTSFENKKLFLLKALKK